MRELKIAEFSLVSGGMTWQDRRESTNVEMIRYAPDGTPVWVDTNDSCKPVKEGNDYCEDGGNY